MSNSRFEYMAILKSDLSRASSVAAYLESVDEPLRGVIWSAREREWVFRPASIAHFHFDPGQEGRTLIVNRSEAERIAREDLGIDVPSEAELRSMCASAANNTES